MGKSLYISRMERELKKKFKKEVKHPIRVIIPIHGPDVDLDAVMKHLQHHMTNVDPINPPAQIFHFDIAPSVSLICSNKQCVLNLSVVAGNRQCGCSAI